MKEFILEQKKQNQAEYVENALRRIVRHFLIRIPLFLENINIISIKKPFFT